MDEAVAGGAGGPTFSWIGQEEQLGKRDRLWDPGFQHRETKDSKPLAVKICGGCGGERNSQPHRRVHWRNPWAPRMYTNPRTWEPPQKGPNLFVGSGKSD